MISHFPYRLGIEDAVPQTVFPAIVSTRPLYRQDIDRTMMYYALNFMPFAPVPFP